MSSLGSVSLKFLNNNTKIIILTYLLKNLCKRIIGSVWCFASAILSPMMVLITYLMIRKEENKDVLI